MFRQAFASSSLAFYVDILVAFSSILSLLTLKLKFMPKSLHHLEAVGGKLVVNQTPIFASGIYFIFVALHDPLRSHSYLSDLNLA